MKNGNWICQRDLGGDITSKPPLFTWLCGSLTILNGRIRRAAGVAWMILAAGRKYLGTSAAVFGAIMLMLGPAGLKFFGLARTDSVFAVTVTAAAPLAWRARNRGGDHDMGPDPLTRSLLDRIDILGPAINRTSISYALNGQEQPYWVLRPRIPERGRA